MSDESNITGPEGESVLAAEYVLGVLPPAQHEAVAARVRTHSAQPADVRFWR
jgi:anti-sigma-K factor RskA